MPLKRKEKKCIFCFPSFLFRKVSFLIFLSECADSNSNFRVLDAEKKGEKVTFLGSADVSKHPSRKTTAIYWLFFFLSFSSFFPSLVSSRPFPFPPLFNFEIARYLIKHIAPSNDDCGANWWRNYLNIIDRYKNIIMGDFAGHTHDDVSAIN